MSGQKPLIPEHGGFRKLKTFHAQLVYDLTVPFCDLYVGCRSRTPDQMVQAARSGVQNIAEGSQASGTLKKTEMKLTSVARASLEELRLDYEDFLRQRGLPLWEPDHPAPERFKEKRCATVEEVRTWIEEERKRLKNTDEHGPARTHTDKNGRASGPCGSVFVRGGPCESVSSSALAANAVLSLLNLWCYLLDRQLLAQAETFEKVGGFSERLYRARRRR